MNEKEKLTKKEIGVKVLKGIAYLVVVGIYMYFLAHRELYTETYGKQIFYAKKKLLVMTLATGGVLFLIWFKNIFSDRVNRILAIIVTVLSPIVAFLGMEYITGTAVFAMEKKYLLINMIVIVLLLVIFLLLTNSLKAGTLLTVGFLLIFATINYFTYTFRGLPILASDIATIRTALSVAGSYTIRPTYEMLWGLLTFMGYLVFLCKLRNTKLFRLFIRVPAIIATAVLCVVLVNQYVVTDKLSNMGVNIRMFQPMDSYQKYGSALTFIRSVKYVLVEEPEGYSLDKVKEIMKDYTSDSAKDESKGKVPNVISIVNETFSDLRVLGNYETNAEVIPFVDSLMAEGAENVIRGWSYSSVCGGMTANTEFEYLTGNSMAFLPSSVVSFQLYVNKPMESLVKNYIAMGTQGNYALHPYFKENYNRPTVYENLGFQYFYGQEDMEYDEEDKVRRYISDEKSYEYVIEKYEEAKEKSEDPFFMYDLTIQNHSPYDMEFDNYDKSIQILGDQRDAQAEQYLQLVHESDRAFQELTEYFSTIDEPTIIIFFGDHQPRVTNSFMKSVTNGEWSTWNNEQMMARYKVPFVVWANYDIEEEYYEMTSMNFIQTIISNNLNLPMTGYQKFQAAFKEQVPSVSANGYYGADGVFYETNDKSSPYYEWIQKYQYIQYNNVFDLKNRVDDFFNLK